ncbi:hypothetical protein FRC00_001421 [Tulasnella sp. 408]|nr:hypothetical protein FRC00_001421 [Tulasnella sp. 408]
MASQQFDPAAHPTSASSGGAGSSGEPLQWGKWQQTKDRRPLAPAAIAKMITRDEQGQVLDPDDIEIDFFLVTCDLWSADGRVEVNLVRNPASAAASRRRKDHASVGGNSDDAEPPAPNRGAPRVHEDVSPVLAQTFTEPFTVYSAKKFPGVPPMTALSLEFGKQGQKLPLRNRPGSAGKGRRGSDEEESGADSDGEGA